jgi:hypothetical protein
MVEVIVIIWWGAQKNVAIRSSGWKIDLLRTLAAYDSGLALRLEVPVMANYLSAFRIDAAQVELYCRRNSGIRV